jgi:hypothetical protein
LYVTVHQTWLIMDDFFLLLRFHCTHPGLWGWSHYLLGLSWLLLVVALGSVRL